MEPGHPDLKAGDADSIFLHLIMKDILKGLRSAAAVAGSACVYSIGISDMPLALLRDHTGAKPRHEITSYAAVDDEDVLDMPFEDDESMLPGSKFPLLFFRILDAHPSRRKAILPGGSFCDSDILIKRLPVLAWNDTVNQNGTMGARSLGSRVRRRCGLVC